MCLLSVVWTEPWADHMSSSRVPKFCFVNGNFYRHTLWRCHPMWMGLVILIISSDVNVPCLLLSFNFCWYVQMNRFKKKNLRNGTLLQGHPGKPKQLLKVAPSNCWGGLDTLGNAVIRSPLLVPMKPQILMAPGRICFLFFFFFLKPSSSFYPQESSSQGSPGNTLYYLLFVVSLTFLFHIHLYFFFTEK